MWIAPMDFAPPEEVWPVIGQMFEGWVGIGLK